MKIGNRAHKQLDHFWPTARGFFGLWAICVIIISLITNASADNPLTPPVAVTRSGLVVGSTTPDGVSEFLGIPYAAPPIGASRWTPPKPYGLFPGFQWQATQFGSECTQPGGIGSEDCLFLNVYTPASRPRANEANLSGRGLPVMFWIHGGSLIRGGSNPYDPTRLVRNGVIVVTINYRLGYLGFFAHPAIDAEDHLSGNYGLMDQQLALKWVRDNIAGFGGNPDRITIFGQSAGGQSVYAQLASPLAEGLFRRAIAESGSYVSFQDYFNFIVPLTTAETTGTMGVPSGTAVSDAVGCTSQTASCLRAVSAPAFIAIEPATLYPFIDDALLPQSLGAAFSSGQFNRVPVLTGTNHDEWRYFVALQYDLVGNPILTAAQYATATAALWGTALQSTVLALYPYANYPTGGEALGASGTDGIFSCPARNAIRSLSNFVTTYAYEFNDENAPPPQSAFGGSLTFPLGAYHTSELQYLFTETSFFGLPTAPLSPSQQQLSDAMISYWTQFAKTGNPNSSEQPAWLPYSTTTDNFQSLMFPTPAPESSFDADHRCSTFWNTF
jgi:para-nitrobenzyl esterase